MSNEINKNIVETYKRKHIVISKKGLIIGSICAGLGIAGAGGTAIYFGVTRQTNNNEGEVSISYEEANEFAKKNYKLTKSDVELYKKADAKNAVASWDFSKTEGIEEEGTPAHTFFYNGLASIFGAIVEDKETKITTKNDNVALNDLTKTFIWYNEREKLPLAEAFFFVSELTRYNFGDLAFDSSHQFNFKKNGDYITFTTIKKVIKNPAYSNRVDCTLNKDGTVNKVYMPIHGYIGEDDAKVLFDGTVNVSFTY